MTLDSNGNVLQSWINTITKAKLGSTLCEINNKFNTKGEMYNDERFGYILKDACINVGDYSIDVNFDFGKRCRSICFHNNRRDRYEDHFSKDHLDVLLLKYGGDFKCLTNISLPESKHFLFYSESSKVLVSVNDGYYGDGFGHIIIDREPKGGAEKLIRDKNKYNLMLRHNFANPHKHIDFKKNNSTLGMPVSQVKKLLRKGITQIPVK